MRWIQHSNDKLVVSLSRANAWRLSSRQITAIPALRVTPSAGSPSANNASCPFALSLRSRLIQKLRTGSRSCVSPLVPKHLFAQKDAKNKTRLHLTLTFARARPQLARSLIPSSSSPFKSSAAFSRAQMSCCQFHRLSSLRSRR